MQDILRLEASDESIDIIRKFLKKTSVDEEEHAIVASHLIFLYSLSNQINEMLYVVDSYTKEYSSKNSIVLLDKLIELTLDTNKEVCLNAIEQKRDLLEVYETEIYYSDMILYNKDNMEERLKYINLFLQDDTSKQTRLNGLFLLAQTYFDYNQFYRFNKYLDTTRELALELGNFEIVESLIYYEATNYFQLEDYKKALEILNSNPVKSEIFGNRINLLIFKIHFKQSNYRKCISLDAQFTESMQFATSDVQKEFYQLCIDLYTIERNSFSIKIFKDKLNEVSKVKDYSELTSIKDNVLKGIKIKSRSDKSIKVETPVFKSIKKVKPTLNEMNDFYQETTFIYSNFYKENDYREKLRLSLIELNNQVCFNDCFIIMVDSSSYHFKKERLYDKENPILEIVERFNRDDSEIISFNTKQDNIINPFNNEIIEYNHAIIFPLFKSKCVGAIYFTSEDSNLIEGKLNFEKLHNFAKFYNSISIINSQMEDVIYDTKSKLEILDSKMFYYGYSDFESFNCNKETKEFLNVSMKTSYNSFVSKININYYKEFLSNMNNLELDSSFSQLVEFNNDKKVLIKVTKINEYKVLFIFEDYTNIENNKDDLINIAYHNPITNLKNNKFLSVEIHKYFDMNKFSAILINFKDLRKYTYLYQEKFSLDILKYLGEILPMFNSEYDYYHLNFDKLIVLIKDTNDKRVVKQIANKLDLYLTEKLSLLNSRVIPRFNYGTYRSFVDTKEKTLDKLLAILSDSILNVDEFSDDNVGFYDIDLYKDRFMKEQLVTYISESIDKKLINVLFSQCVNVQENVIEFYEANLNLSNYKVDSRILDEVIKRRNLTTSLEQYLIQRTFHEMNLIYEKTNFSINVILNIDEYSLVKKSFINYLDSMCKQFKITKQRIIIKIEKVYEGAIDNITYLINSGYNIALVNIDDLSYIKPSYFLLNNFKKLNVFNDEYIKSLSNILSSLDVKFILDKTNKNEEIEHYKNDIKYFMGDIYKTQLTYLDIINIFKQDLVI